MYYYPNQTNQFQAPQQQMTLQNPMFLKGRPVTSIEEVRAAQVDFDGSLFIFPDIANNKIYTKQINLDGTASINVFELSKAPIETNKPEYVTKEEFEEQLKKFNSLFEKLNTPQQQQQQYTF